MLKFFALAATALATAAAPALAAKPDAPTLEIPADKAQPQTRICVVQPPLTGTRLPRRVCHTREQWEAEGVTVRVR